MVFITALRQASKRVPMIKFRKGGPVMSASAGSQPQAAGAPAVSSQATAPHPVSSLLQCFGR